MEESQKDHLPAEEWEKLFSSAAISRNPRNDEENYSRTTYVHNVDKKTAIEIAAILNSKDPIEENSNFKNSEFQKNFLNIKNGSMAENLKSAMFSRSKLDQNTYIDEKYIQELEKKKLNPKYLKIWSKRKVLPIFRHREKILQSVEENQVVLISGETGCGKTTQVPQFLLDDAIENSRGSTVHIACTQPRRISAISVAERVAQERVEDLGESVGYQIRLEKIPSRENGSIIYCTTGMLLQYMQRDPCLKNYSHIILDEIHERSVESDFVMALFKKVLPERQDLKIILMSATIDSERFSEFYNNCPVLKLPGSGYPIRDVYLPEILTVLKKNRNVVSKSSGSERHYLDRLKPDDIKNPEKLLAKDRKNENLMPNIIEDLVHYISRHEEAGAILIFVPGFRDIQNVIRRLRRSSNKRTKGEKYEIYQLYSQMPSDEQKKVFNPTEAGVRKIIVSTNIAEISVTIDDIVYVIDSGKMKVKNFDIRKNLVTLDEVDITIANASQRKGRAGRVQPGICFKLYSKKTEDNFEAFPVPDIQRSRLEEVILTLKLLQLGKSEIFFENLIDPPCAKAIEISLERLLRLKAIDPNENLTPLGYHLAHLPLDPQAGKMLIWASIFSCLDPILSIAATLAYKSPFYTPISEEEQQKARDRKFELTMGEHSDHIALAMAIRKYDQVTNDNNESIKFCQEYFLAWHTLKVIVDHKEQIASQLNEIHFLRSKNFWAPEANENSSNLALVKAVVCAGLFPNVAIVKDYEKNGKAILWTPENGNVYIENSSVSRKRVAINIKYPEKYVCYYSKQEYRIVTQKTHPTSQSIYLQDVTNVGPFPLLLASCLTAEEGIVESICVLPHIKFSFGGETKLIKCLLENLKYVVEKEIGNPGNIEDDSYEKNVIRAMIKLISSAGK